MYLDDKKSVILTVAIYSYKVTILYWGNYIEKKIEIYSMEILLDLSYRMEFYFP